MAKQRMINTKIWEDAWFSSLDQIEQLVFIYFLTNPMTNIVGTYELSKGTITRSTGLETRVLDEILERFEKSKKVFYRNGWVIIHNFIKHQNYRSPKIKIGIEKELESIPDTIKSLIIIPYANGIDTISHLNLNSNLNSNLNPKEPSIENKLTPIQEVVNYFFGLKGWPLDGEKKIVYSRFTRPAKDLLYLCDEDIEEAKQCLKKVATWADSRKLDYSIETVFKKWYDIDKLRPKEKKPYVDGYRAFKSNGQWKIITTNGEIKTFTGLEKDIKYK